MNVSNYSVSRPRDGYKGKRIRELKKKKNSNKKNKKHKDKVFATTTFYIVRIPHDNNLKNIV